MTNKPPKKSPAIWLVRYINSEGVAADCHPDTFATKKEAKAQGAEFMRHLNWAVCFQVYRERTRYVVRDIATRGCDFLLWGDDNPKAAAKSLAGALADGLAVELITMPADSMDPHTKRLIDGA